MIVAFSGKAGSGKDTAADILVREKNFVKIAFADPMKRACKDWFDFTEEQLWGPSAERNRADLRWPRTIDEFGNVTQYLTPRHALQQLGTEFGRACSPEVWVRYGIRMARSLDGREGVSYDGPNGSFRCSRQRISGVVITDCRFANEIDAVQAAGGKVFRIHRSDLAEESTVAGHASEANQDGIPDERFDGIVLNNWNLEIFRENVLKLLTLPPKKAGVRPICVPSRDF